MGSLRVLPGLRACYNLREYSMGVTNAIPELASPIEQQKSDLDKHGYCFIENALSSDEVAALRTRLEEQAAAELQRGDAYQDAGPDGAGVNQRLWFLVNKGKVFRDLLFHKRARELVGHVLEKEYVLSSFTANIARPGGIMEPHTDQWWLPWPVIPGQRSVPAGSMTREAARGANMDPERPHGMISPVAALRHHSPA